MASESDSTSSSVSVVNTENVHRSPANRPWKFRLKLWLSSHLPWYASMLRTRLYALFDAPFLSSGLDLEVTASNARKCLIHRDEETGESMVLGQRFRGRMRRSVRMLLLEVPVEESKALIEGARTILAPFVRSRNSKAHGQDAGSTPCVMMEDPTLCHIPVFALGTEAHPRPLSLHGIEQERRQIIELLRGHSGTFELCLDRIVLTDTGEVLALFQIASGTTANIDHVRADLVSALSQAPKYGQLDLIVHATLARLLVKRRQLAPKLRRRMCALARQVSQSLNIKLSIDEIVYSVLSRRLSSIGNRARIPLGNRPPKSQLWGRIASMITRHSHILLFGLGSLMVWRFGLRRK